MQFYHDWAVRILGGQWTDGKAFYGLPGYAYLLAAIFSVGGVNPWIVGFIQALIEATSALVIYRIGYQSIASLRTDSLDREKQGQFVGLVAAVSWGLFVPAQSFSVILMPTCWLVLAFWGLVLWIMSVRSDSWWKTWLGMGLVVGFVSMLVATVLFLTPLIVTAIMLKVENSEAAVKKWATRAAALGVFAASVFLGAAPAWIHNYFIAHEPVLLSAHSGLNMWIGNSPYANGYPKIPPGLRASQEGLLRDSIILAEREAGHPLTRAEVSKYWNAKAKAWINENPSAWRKLLLVKLGNFWNAYQYDDLSVIKLLQLDAIVTPGIGFGLVAAFGLPGLLLGSWNVPRLRWVAAAVLLHMAALLPVFVTERYRLCAVPGLLICAAWLLLYLWKTICRKQFGMAILVLIPLGISSWFVSIARPDPTNWALDHYKAGIRAIDATNLDLPQAQIVQKLNLAERELRTAYSYVPENSEIVFALGNLRLAQHRIPAAKHWYAQTLQMSPHHTGAWNNLGVIAMGEKQWDLAEKAFQESISGERSDAKLFYLIAKARAESGNKAGAIESLDRAIKLNPRPKEFHEFKKQLEGSMQ